MIVHKFYLLPKIVLACAYIILYSKFCLHLYIYCQTHFVGVQNLVYGTDGEVAIENALEKVFPIEDIGSNINIHLRCFTHFENDIERFCNKNGISVETRKLLVYSILGYEKDG